MDCAIETKWWIALLALAATTGMGASSFAGNTLSGSEKCRAASCLGDYVCDEDGSWAASRVTCTAISAPQRISSPPPETRRIFYRHDIEALLTDPAVRHFVGLAEYAWDFTAPDSMPGFGPLPAAIAGHVHPPAQQHASAVRPE